MLVKFNVNAKNKFLKENIDNVKIRISITGNTD